jgi:hypothetical protein
MSWKRWLNRRAAPARARRPQPNSNRVRLALDRLEEKTLPSGASVTSADNPSFAGNSSTDGRFSVYVSSADDLVAGEQIPTGSVNLYLYDRTTNSSVLVNHVAGSPLTASDGLVTNPVPAAVPSPGSISAFAPSTDPLPNTFVISGNGRYVLFRSTAADLVAGEQNPNHWDSLYLYDAVTGLTQMLTRQAGTTATATDPHPTYPYTIPLLDGATEFGFSGDSGHIVFSSGADNLIPGEVDPNRTDLDNPFPEDPNDPNDPFKAEFAKIYEYDIGPGATRLIDHAVGAPTTVALQWWNGGTPQLFYHGVSDDGRYVLYGSDAIDLGGNPGNPQNHVLNLYVYDELAGGPTHPGESGSLTSLTENPPGGGQPYAGDAYGSFYHIESWPVISANGQGIAFLAIGYDSADQLWDYNLYLDHFDTQTQTWQLQLITHSAAGGESDYTDYLDDGSYFRYTIDPSGRYVVYGAYANDLVANEQKPDSYYGLEPDLYVYDALTGQSKLIDHIPGQSNVAANGFSTALFDPNGRSSFDSVQSADGLHVLYTDYADNLVPNEQNPNHLPNLYLYDVTTDTNVLVTHEPGNPFAVSTGQPGTSYSFGGTYSGSYTGPAVSPDGSRVYYGSSANDLVAGEVNTNGTYNLYVYDAPTGQNSLLTHAAGQPAVAAGGVQGQIYFDQPGSFAVLPVTPDGRFVLFTSTANNLVPAEQNPQSFPNVYLFDTQAGQSVLVSHTVPGTIVGQAWVDANGNGQLDPGEAGFQGILVTLFDGSGNVVGTTFTDASGHYAFGDLVRGQYRLSFSLPGDWLFTAEHVGNPDTDSDVDPSGFTDLFSLNAGGSVEQDAGYVYNPPPPPNGSGFQGLLGG